jgi:sugar lactone lactonase YvrE
MIFVWFPMFLHSLLDTVPCQNILGEGVQWNDRDQSIWWTDIQSAKIFSYSPANKQLREWNTPERVGCFAFCDTDERLLVAFASGIAWLDLASDKYEWIARPELAIAGNRFNDGRVDREGRFWVGSIVERSLSDDQTAALYCLDQQLLTTCHLTGLRISNSLCWSPDSRHLYHADSPTHSIRVFDFDAQTGVLANPRVFAETTVGVEPDGACIDVEGCLWSAQWGGGCVVRYAPDGRELTRLELPFSQPTCVAFGGPQLDWLLVTSARQGLSAEQLRAQPQAGNLLIYQTNIRGLPECRFKCA